MAKCIKSKQNQQARASRHCKDLRTQNKIPPMGGSPRLPPPGAPHAVRSNANNTSLSRWRGAPGSPPPAGGMGVGDDDDNSNEECCAQRQPHVFPYYSFIKTNDVFEPAWAQEARPRRTRPRPGSGARLSGARQALVGVQTARMGQKPIANLDS